MSESVFDGTDDAATPPTRERIEELLKFWKDVPSMYAGAELLFLLDYMKRELEIGRKTIEFEMAKARLEDAMTRCKEGKV